MIALAFQCGLSYREFWDEVTFWELQQIYKGYQMRMLDQYEVAAWMSANIMSASSGKRVKPQKLFDRKKAEKELFRKSDYKNMRERYERAKRIAEEVNGWRRREE